MRRNDFILYVVMGFRLPFLRLPFKVITYSCNLCEGLILPAWTFGKFYNINGNIQIQSKKHLDLHSI